MKEATKELVEWIKETLHKWASSTPYEKEGSEKYYNSLKFLDSLPEIESHLCRGGYIQDKNGTPCCDGDKVKYNDITGQLIWDKEHSRFLVEFKYPSFDNILHHPVFRKEIKKVEK